MEKSQYKLCLEILRRLDAEGILKHVILIGSWCTLFYQEYFGDCNYAPVLKTRDMDLLILRPSGLKRKIDVATLLKDLGFVVGFTGREGYLRLEHPQLVVEFLVPERGRPSTRPFPLPQLGLNAQALRYMEYLGKQTISIRVQDLEVTVPHPAHFALHKLVVLTKRPIPEKQIKDRRAARTVLTALCKSDRSTEIREAFLRMPTRWQTRVKKQLSDPIDAPLLAVVEGGAYE